MIRDYSFLRIIIFIFLFSSFYVISVAEKKYSVQEAQRVLKAIQEISNEQFRQNKSTLKKIVITESELNSYIAYHIETEKEEIMKELQFKLFHENRVEGKILIDLTGREIPKFLRPRMTFYLGGKIEVEDEKVKFIVKKLFLEGQPIQPMVLDLIIYIASKIENTEASSINDWYDLPYGIKNMEIQKGKAIFYY